MTASNTHPNVETLRAVYADLRRIAEFSDDAVVLHPAERSHNPDAPSVRGKGAVLQQELQLLRMTEGTLRMDVEQIIANDHFGAVTGRLRAEKSGRTMAMPFCGLWRFRDGRIVEHWENAYDAGMFGAFLMGGS